MKMDISEEIANPVEDIKNLLIAFNDNKVDYYDRITNINTVTVTKKTHL